jgi:hypothetical protein
MTMPELAVVVYDIRSYLPDPMHSRAIGYLLLAIAAYCGVRLLAETKRAPLIVFGILAFCCVPGAAIFALNPPEPAQVAGLVDVWALGRVTTVDGTVSDLALVAGRSGKGITGASFTLSSQRYFLSQPTGSPARDLTLPLEQLHDGVKIRLYVVCGTITRLETGPFWDGIGTLPADSQR